MWIIALLSMFGKAEASFIMVEPGVPYHNWGNLAFGDFDNDGDLDVITIGDHTYQGVYSRQAVLFRNEGNWQFTHTDFVFGEFVSGGVAWADFNNDGWLDVILSGAQFTSGINRPIKLFQNNAGQSFSLVDQTFHDTSYSNLIWADVDNDFDMDIITLGALGTSSDLCIYYNLGNGEFQYDPISYLPNFISAYTGYLSTIDFNRDGYLDLSVGAAKAIGGIYSPKTLVWRRTPSGIYESVFGDDIGGGYGFAWFDYDCDGDLDFLYTGYQDNIGADTVLLLNEHSLYMVADNCFPPIDNGDLAAADYDNDGDEDLFFSGGHSLSTVSNLYRNDGSGVFTDADLGLQPVCESYAFWADLDNDSDLDLIYTGDGWTMFYRNDVQVPNQPPSAPVLSYSPEGGFVISGAIDSATPQPALTYDLRIGTSPGAADIYHPMADLETGYRRVTGPGRPCFTAHRLPAGYIYYASAQAIDGGFMGSAWGPEIVIDLSVATDDQLQAPLVPKIYPNPFSDLVNIRIDALPSPNLSAGIYNLRGQMIRGLHAQNGNSETNLGWDGRDEQGNRVSNGIYYLRLIQNGHTTAHKILLIR
jgi:hypothetical protein